MQPHDAVQEPHDRHRGLASPKPVSGRADGAGNLSDVPPLPKAVGRRHVIIMIGDGMQLAHEIAASRYLYGHDQGLSFHTFPERTYKTTWDVSVYNARAQAIGADELAYSPDRFNPVVGYDPAIGGKAPYPVLDDNELRRSYFLSGIYPDSASTATAMSSGIKTNSASIAWRPGAGEDGAVETSPQLLRRFYGMSIGFVTTVPFSHATPAGFFSHNPSRSNYTSIAREMLTETRPDVLIGGAWENHSYYDGSDLNQLIASDEYVLVHSEPGVDGAAAVLAGAVRANQANKRLIGIFGATSEGNFPSPVPIDSPGNPAITRGSLESPPLADASLAALEVLSRDPDGFFLLIEQGDIDWSNHANDYARMIGCVSDLDSAVRAVVAYVDRPDDAIDWSNTTLLVTADHANSYLRFVQTLHEGDLPRQETSVYPDGEVTYGTGSHTSELVSVYAKGFAAAKLHEYETVYPGLGIIDDTSIYRVTLDAARR
ncbi:MAG TPA: alkaline phosphatase [Polyangiaceae bacterium]